MAADGLAARSVMYALLALHQMANYITRLAVPFIVPYLCNDFGFSEPQRAMLLNAFTPGYVMLQIPAGWFAARWGAKRLVTTHCLAIAGLLLLLPSLARRGAWAAAACIFAFGLAQAPFSVGSNIAKANWVPTGKERAWALMLISLGTTLSKNVSSFLTPWLSGRRGWRSVTTSYALGVAAFAGAWQLLASEHPKKPAVRPVLAPAAPAASPSRGAIAHFVKAKAERLPEAERRFFLEAAERLCWSDGEWREHSGKRWADGRWQDQPAEPARKRGEREDDQRTVQFDIERPDPGEEAGEKIGIWRLLLSAPTVANILNHMQHDMHEFQVLAAWAPTYYNQVLGVPLAQVGSYTLWPMVCAIPAKFVIAAWESALIGRGWSVRGIRQAAGVIAAAVAIPCGTAFALAPNPRLATIAYAGFVAGQVFDNAADGANVLEIGGPDMADIASYSSTAAWLLGLICSTTVAAVKQLTGSWRALFLLPVASRALIVCYWWRRCSARSAREYVLATSGGTSPAEYLARQNQRKGSAK